MKNIDLIYKLKHSDLEFFVKHELPKIDLETVSRFIVNPDIKDFLLEYLWEVGAADPFIKMTEELPISHDHMCSAYRLLDQDGIYYTVLPSGAVVSWI